MRVWEVRTAREILVFTAHTAAVHAAVFSPHGHWIASGRNESVLKIWDSTDGHELRCIPQNDWVGALPVSPDGGLLASACGFYATYTMDRGSGGY